MLPPPPGPGILRPARAGVIPRWGWLVMAGLAPSRPRGSDSGTTEAMYACRDSVPPARE